MTLEGNLMTIEAKVIEDSVSVMGARLTTLQLKFHRYILPEFNTHRAFSRNASSSRAIPVAKMLEQVRTDPAMPIHWGKNQPGMQAHEELSDEMDPTLGTSRRQYIKNLWAQSAEQAADIAKRMSDLGAHKQVVNRILEPFQNVHVIVSATEWSNFFALRCHPDAQPEIQTLATEMRNALNQSTAKARPEDDRTEAGWHLPYITSEEREVHRDMPLLLARMSAARCARVSYLNHKGKAPSIDEDLKLYHRLVGASPIHASPVEHQGTPLPNRRQPSRNFRGWKQYRELVEVNLP
jgi:hypothetical protein